MDEEIKKFKLLWEELAYDALRVFKNIRELEGESVKLIERKKAGENVKDLLKQNKGELKKLREKEFEIYFDRKNVLKTIRERQTRVTCPNCGAVNSMKELKAYNGGVLYPMPPTPKGKYFCSECGYLFLYKNIDFESLESKYKFSNLTKEDELVLYKRDLYLADRLRIKRIKICFVVFLALFLPFIIVIIAVFNL